MKLEQLGLRGRLAAALTTLAAGAAALLALAFWAGEEYLERDSLQSLLSHEAAAGRDTPAERALLAYNEDLTQRRAYWLFALLFTGTGAVAVTAWWLSGRVARAGLQPLGELVGQIRALDVEARGGPRLLHSADPELQVIVAALNAHMAQLDALIQRERIFSAAASHELRTPLTVIGGASAVLSGLPQVPAAVLGRIDRAVAQARRDLEALLALSRATDAEHHAPLRLDLLLPEIAALHLEADADAGTRVHWDMTPPVERTLSAGALSIVFGNILRNALHAARGGEVRIAVNGSGLSVSDNGPGLPPELLTLPLQPLGTRSDGGSGLGLYIAQNLARRQGWQLSLGRSEAGGARVELQFCPPVT